MTGAVPAGPVHGVGTGSRETYSQAGKHQTQSVAGVYTVRPTYMRDGMVTPIDSVGSMGDCVGPRIEKLHVTYRVREFDD
eukprot:4427-Eustigmatos_ZCMA.PRE.1